MDKRLKRFLADVQGFLEQLNDDGMDVTFISVYASPSAIMATATVGDVERREYTLYTESGRFTKTTEVTEYD